MDYTSLIMVVVMIAMLYFLMIRPENKRKQQAEDMRNSLKKGDQITTIGGIVGRIVMVNADTIVIETSDDRVRMELAKWSVSTNNTQQQAAQQQAAQQKAARQKEKKEEKKEEPAKIGESSEGKES